MKKKKQRSLRRLKEILWKVFSEYIRSKDADEGGTTYCYTCTRPVHWKYEAQAGHAIPGRRNAVLFDEEIVRPQCYSCNAPHIGNGQQYIFATKLIKENSLEWWEKKLEGARQVVKYTRADIEQMIENYKAKLI